MKVLIDTSTSTNWHKVYFGGLQPDLLEFNNTCLFDIYLCELAKFDITTLHISCPYELRFEYKKKLLKTFNESEVFIKFIDPKKIKVNSYELVISGCIGLVEEDIHRALLTNKKQLEDISTVLNTIVDVFCFFKNKKINSTSEAADSYRVSLSSNLMLWRNKLIEPLKYRVKTLKENELILFKREVYGKEITYGNVA